jgi:hypothetical protein
LDKKDTKIYAIHKGIAIPTEDLIVDPTLVAVVEDLLGHIKTGRITEVCYAGVGDEMDSVRGMAGKSKNPFLLSSQLGVLDMLYKEEVIYPILLNADHYEDVDE